MIVFRFLCEQSNQTKLITLFFCDENPKILYSYPKLFLQDEKGCFRNLDKKTEEKQKKKKKKKKHDPELDDNTPLPQIT